MSSKAALHNSDGIWFLKKPVQLHRQNKDQRWKITSTSDNTSWQFAVNSFKICGVITEYVAHCAYILSLLERNLHKLFPAGMFSLLCFIKPWCFAMALTVSHLERQSNWQYVDFTTLRTNHSKHAWVTASFSTDAKLFYSVWNRKHNYWVKHVTKRRIEKEAKERHQSRCAHCGVQLDVHSLF